jgi:hypothetical protein
MKTILLSAGMLFTSLIASAQCTPQTTLNEDFADFTIATSGAFPQNCWSTIAPGFPTGVSIYTAQSGSPANQYTTFYPSTFVNTAGYLITPELSTIDGAHELSFSTWKVAGQGGAIPAGNVTLQVGTISNITDGSTFTAFGSPITLTSGNVQTYSNIVLPAAPAGSHIAFKISSDAVHNAIAIDNVVWDAVATTPTCPAVTTLNENFDAFVTATGFPQNCWSKIAAGPLVYLGGDAGNNTALFYSLFSPNTNAYLVTPQISTIDGNHVLSFDASLAPGSSAGQTVTLQPGTLSNPADAATFVAVGNPIVLSSSTSASYTNIAIPASATQGYVAFRFNASGVHTAASLDNVVWQSATAGTGTVKANAFSIFPNPTSDKNVTLNYNNLSNGQVSVYAITGAKVYETAVSGTTQNINLTALSAGMYVVKLQSGNYTATQKLIIK